MSTCRFLRALVLASACFALAADAPGSLASLEKRSRGRLGVAAQDLETGRTMEFRARERFSMCSTFKLLLVAQIYHKVDAGKESLDRIIAYGPSDLLDHAPVTRRHVAEKGMSVQALCAASLEFSDNTAANLLLASLGGPPAFTAWVRAQGDATTRLDRFEPALNTPVPGQELDTTTPAAMLASMRNVLLGKVLSPGSRERLTRELPASATGAARLRAGLPAPWRLGHKTGSGDGGATHDIGIILRPGKGPILVTAYYMGSAAPMGEREAVLAEVGRIVSRESWE